MALNMRRVACHLAISLSAILVVGAAACAAERSPQVVAAEEQSIATTPAEQTADGFILKAGGGESLLNGLVIKASPQTGTEGSILVEQTFPRGGTTGLHIHDQGDELFYVVSGRGTATLGDTTEMIEAGDVILVARGAVHRVGNLDHDEPLRLVFFMDSPELVEEFRAIHTRVTSEPDRPMTPEEGAAIRARTGGSRRAP